MTGQARRVDEQLATFCEAEHAQLTGLLTLVTGDRHIAEELAQEALERACSNWPRVHVMDNRRAWLRLVALNLAASRYRRRRAGWRDNRRHGEPTVRSDGTAVSVAIPRRIRHHVRRGR
jgi:RNA polymerase sigma-70 factor, ECF subfamily